MACRRQAWFRGLDGLSRQDFACLPGGFPLGHDKLRRVLLAEDSHKGDVSSSNCTVSTPF
jgi:hypothetical protein